MTLEKFTNSADGIINDYENNISNGKEFRSAIMGLLIEVAQPYLSNKTEANFENGYRLLYKAIESYKRDNMGKFRDELNLARLSFDAVYASLIEIRKG